MLHIETGKDNQILRTICEPVKKSEWTKYAKLGREMRDYIKNPLNAGVGLAAPQVGVTKRIMVVSLMRDWEDESFSTVIMINPEILVTSSETICDIEEGCLSLPKTKKGYVARYKDIKLRYFDESMKERILKLSGLASVIVQHEIDHLNGELYIDKLI
ncbi:peptide deformylase [Candidatus Gracilibacteria bacterium]|nr:peptide deformylase [Candidatus Gracilibacteria bacterium]